MQELANQEIEATFQKAQSLFGFNRNIMPVKVSFDNMGRTAGQAVVRRGFFQLRLNVQLLTEEYREHLVETIRHEIAHLVCFYNPSLGKNHDRGWQRVCVALGGKPDRCHQLPLKKARRSRKALYNINGEELPVGLTVHRRIQGGARYSAKGLGRIEPHHFTGKVITT